jgi:hypothetical protein
MIFIRVSHIKCHENLVKGAENKKVNRQGCSKGISLKHKVTATSHSKVSLYYKLVAVILVAAAAVVVVVAIAVAVVSMVPCWFTFIRGNLFSFNDVIGVHLSV